MQLILDASDFSKLKPSTRADLLAHLFPRSSEASSENAADFDWADVVDLTPGQVEDMIAGCSDPTVRGLRVVAEFGPVFNAAKLDEEEGIDNFGHFHGRVTKRTRTITGDRHVGLFTWNEEGQYAVSAETFRSLRIYFNLEA